MQARTPDHNQFDAYLVTLLVTAPMLLFAVGVTAATFGWLWWV